MKLFLWPIIAGTIIFMSSNIKTRVSDEKYSIQEGLLGGTLPFYAIGKGKPLIVIRTVTPESGNPTGASQWAEQRALKPYINSYKVYAVSRDPKATSDTDMAAFARQYANAIQKEFTEPVRVLGISTGGSLALQLAADHPAIVKSLAVIASSYKLSPQGKSLQAKYAHFLQRHDQRNAEKTLAPLITKTKIGEIIMGVILWLTAPLTGKPEYEQMVAFLHAEDTFNLQKRLSSMSTPTLLVAGDQDKVYSFSDVAYMAKTMPHATLQRLPGAGHREVMANSALPKQVKQFFTEN